MLVHKFYAVKMITQSCDALRRLITRYRQRGGHPALLAVIFLNLFQTKKTCAFHKLEIAIFDIQANAQDYRPAAS
jgi:hypothetical protein